MRFPLRSVLVGIWMLGAVVTARSDDLAQGFERPPNEALPRTWWHWVDKCVTREGITGDLEAMKKAGLGGVQLFTLQLNLKDPVTHEPLKGDVQFLSPKWRELVGFAVSECKRLGLEFSMLDCEGWGEGGGRSVTPAEGSQMVVWSTEHVSGGGKISLHLPRPVAEPRYYEDIALLAYPSPPGDDIAAPTITQSATLDRPTRRPNALKPLLIMPYPWPGKPQWIMFDYGTPQTFRTAFLEMNDMRDVEDPETWEHSPYLDFAAVELLHDVPGPHYFELQASDEGKTFRPVGRISTHGTTSFPATTARYFRIWMPVPPPLQLSLPFKGTEAMEITGVSLGGARIDRPETRAGKYVDFDIRQFSGKTVPPGSAVAPDQIVDLTGRSEWDAPPGKWTLLRIGHASTDSQVGPADLKGLEADKLSRTAVWNFLEKGSVGTVISDEAPHVGTTIKDIVCDSWERGYENWTPRMREEFRTRRGYSIDRWLPALAGQVVESEEASERFLWDFRRTIADLLAENYYGTMQDFAHPHGMGVAAEATGHGLPTIADQLLCKGRTDVPMGEFWVGHAASNHDDPKEAASAAHIYGKKFAGAESFTARPEFGSWTKDPFMLKPEGDLILCTGITRMSMHHFVHQPWPDKLPGLTMGQVGSNLERGNTWWDEIGAWYTYLGRCEYLLQRGQFVADLCYYYGEDAPVDFNYQRMSPPLPTGYDFDVCNAEILERMTVHDGKLTLPSGMSYRVLVLPQNDRMTPHVARAVERLVRDGATVVGPRPEKSPSLANYPECDRTVKSIADVVWGDDARATWHNYGAGRVARTSDLAAATGLPPDFATDNNQIHFIHRRDGSAEIYFLSNQSQREATALCTFRVKGLAPEFWHPDTGRRERAALYSISGGRTTLPIHFDPAGSVFVVFREVADAGDGVASVSQQRTLLASGGDLSGFGSPMIQPPVVSQGRATLTVWSQGEYTFKLASGRAVTRSVTDLAAPIEIAGSWKLTFPPRLGAPPSVTLDRLESWTESKYEGVKYFSGTAAYTKTFTVPAEALRSGDRHFLDLGTVKNLCRVSLNGHDLGILWKPPFRVELGTALQPGDNRLEIAVTNLWPNRMIGDLKLPPNQRITWATFNPFTLESPLLPSGLLGPVLLRTAVDVSP